MSLDFSASQKVNQEYPLNCEIRSKVIHYEDENINGQKFRESTVMYYLVPKDSTYQVMFLDAWLPTVEDEVFEVAGIVHSPINKAGRFGVRRNNNDCNAHHLYIMTEALDEELKRYIAWSQKEGGHRDGSYPSIKITILPQNKEEELDV